jgi:hypothetical protein
MKTDPFVKHIIIIIIVLIIIGSAISLVFNKLDVALGIIGGGAVGILQFIMMARSLNFVVKMIPSRAQKLGGLYTALRFIGSLALLILLASIPSVNIFGIIIGYVFLRIAIYLGVFFESRLLGKGDNRN